MKTSEYSFAGQRLRIRIVGLRLASFIEAAFSPLRVARDGSAPDLLVDLWHEAETGVDCPGRVPFADPRAKGRFQASADNRYVLHSRAHSETSFDRRDRRIVGWVFDTDRLNIYELGRPLNSELLLWNKDRGLQALHAGLIAKGDDGVLVAGPSRVGKTTTSLACLMGGLQFLSDDYVALESSADGFLGHTLFGSAYVEGEHLKRFPLLAPHAIAARYSDEEKLLIPLARVGSGTMSPVTRVRALLLPTITDSPSTRLRPAGKGEAFRRLAPSSLLVLRRAGVDEGRGRHEELEQLSRLVSTLPSYWLEIGGAIEQIPERIGGLLEEVG
ncbi:MAG: hypothetical protein V3T24_11400 [Longimicrobiales bacterium]